MELNTALFERMKRLHGTSGHAFVFAGSGSTGWEASIANIFSPGERVLVIVAGSFGERWAQIAGIYGLDVERLDVEWGKCVDPGELATKLASMEPVKAVFLTHNETSTGVLNPLAEISEIVHQSGALLFADAVSSAGAMPFDMDALGVDLVLSGSQKAWMCPPGLTIMGVGERIWEHVDSAGYPRYLWDFRRIRDAADQGRTLSTGPLPLLYALDEASRMIEDEGLDNVYRRHCELKDFTRSCSVEAGYGLLTDEESASPTITALTVPDGKSAKQIADRIRESHGVELATGLGHLDDSVIRVGHMGWTYLRDIERIIPMLREALKE